MKEIQGILQITLAGGVGADEDRQGTEIHRRFTETFEIGKLDFFQHGKHAD